MLSISKSVDKSLLSLLAALSDDYPVCFVEGTDLSPLQNSKIVAPFLDLL